jgi:hypothetical protein
MFRPMVGPPGSGAELELCEPCTRRLRRFTLELPPDCEAVDYRAIPLSCTTCRAPMLALVGITAVTHKGKRRTAEEQREALAAFKGPWATTLTTK